MQLSILEGTRRAAPFTVTLAGEREIAAYLALRREVFVAEQGLFAGSDADDSDDDPRRLVLVAVTAEGDVLGGVRLAPVERGRDLGWWTGSRLVVSRAARGGAGIGAALVRAACAEAETRGVLRFEASVQTRNEVLFRRLGWDRIGEVTVAGAPHVRMRWPIDRLDRAARSAKAALGSLLAPFAARGGLGGAGFVGDDGAPVPGTHLIAVCDAIVPSMVERYPEWAGWCSVLVNVNDLTAMGASGVGLVDAIGARDASFAARVVEGIASAAQAWGLPVLGGHTQLGVPAALSVTGLGRTDSPVPGAATVGDELSVTADLSGGWRPGFAGTQWDSTSRRRSDELRAMADSVGFARPRAAKDVSMAGLVGTVGMLAEASGGGAVLDLAAVPTPRAAATADWLACFPGFAMITADRPGESRMGTPMTSTAAVGRVVAEPGVRLRWPDGVETVAIAGAVTGLGAA
ncbi:MULTISPECIES: MSMEG_0567/sll0787 family protein [unclassified Rathayibacter]|uniref:MSMEG_0567/sll0787 family protein n=1 Tax=unclassified Rathayibacter TaxID=2609250 RepID=UPI00188DC074|nr:MULTISPECIES: MSMEG_0567/sll0787 family protein [unclassified Rathayibacter]MBF4461052.1 GNAT family N-acetyltransferase [Rathayibacter sp. VKM Ac-2879]MBF4502463.1 GNAT family N-acetyltransferase [Rathayibacter sp. VKM Ac-2878]